MNTTHKDCNIFFWSIFTAAKYCILNNYLQIPYTPSMVYTICIYTSQTNRDFTRANIVLKKYLNASERNKIRYFPSLQHDSRHVGLKEIYQAITYCSISGG
jgi:hypothetical protein